MYPLLSSYPHRLRSNDGHFDPNVVPDQYVLLSYCRPALCLEDLLDAALAQLEEHGAVYSNMQLFQTRLRRALNLSHYC